MNKRAAGAVYEQRAADYLEKCGYRILQRNFRCRMGEIDIIAQDPGSDESSSEESTKECGIRESRIRPTLVFVEVKYRRTAGSGGPEEAVTKAKQRTICRVADFYRTRYRIDMRTPCRFDVIAIEGERLRHRKNAFLYCC